MVEALWTPSPARIQAAQIHAFRQRAAALAGRELADYDALWQWSIEDRAAFWSLVAHESKMKWHTPPTAVVSQPDQMQATRWFPGGRFNFAEMMLRHTGDQPAIIALDERGGTPRTLSRDDLRTQVARVAQALIKLGVTQGDRVAAWMPNREETVITMLASASIGAIFSSSSPDFGVRGVLDRFGQIKPKVLLATDAAYYNGRVHPHHDKLEELVESLGDSLLCTVIVPALGTSIDIKGAVLWDDWIASDSTTLQYASLDFNHPLYIMYSSGTTGVPKCIVHGHGGTLLQHYKEHVLHSDVRDGDKVFYYTTTGWMMWNWLVSALGVGATIVLWDGSPVQPTPNALWRMASTLGVTHFGTSPKYLGTCRDQGQVPRVSHDLSKLRVLMSTGAPLSDALFSWVYSDIKADLQLASISGGTDIISCFMLGVPTEPVYAGEICKRGLGMAVDAYGPDGHPASDRLGELVCTASFPSMPVAFWNDPTGSRYHAAYFDVFPGIWRHGDWIQVTQHQGVIVFGRSDATLNPSGVRIGTAEIYAPTEALEQVAESVVVGLPLQDDVVIVLFVVLHEGYALDNSLLQTIKQAIRRNATPRHVPFAIFAAPSIPRTRSGKKVEIAVRSALLGQKAPNRDALGNPDALDWFATEGRKAWQASNS